MSGLSRRDLFRFFFGRKTSIEAEPETGLPASTSSPPASSNPQDAGPPPLALILDRFCLAWQGSFCSVCSERCPEPGAILTENGKPRVNPDRCTGCHICHDVCPAPKNAVFFVSRAPRPGMIGRTVAETQPTATPDV